MFRWELAEDIGYTPKTTFWQDFCIADRFGLSAIRDTFKRSFREWRHDYVYLTELVMVVNHKCWEYYETNKLYSQLYYSLFEESRTYGFDNLEGDELSYFITTLD